VDGFTQMGSVRPYVSGTYQEAGRQLAFEDQIPVIDGRYLPLVVWIPSQVKIALPERSVLRRRKGRGKGIVPGLTCAFLEGLSRSLGTERVAERSRARSDSTGLQKQLRTVGRGIYETVVVHAADSRVVEDAGATAQAGLTVAKNVPGEAQPRG